MRHVIGIDAGGTKTRGLLADQTGRVVGEAMGPGANISTGGELAVEKALHEVIDRLLVNRDIAPAAIAIGMAGADRADDHRIVRAILHRIARGARAVVTHDALIALVAGAGDGVGIVVIAGTGSIAFGRDRDNRSARAGGWGYVLADEGSGYWIGRQALTAVMREYDRRGPATSLTPLVLSDLRLEDPAEIGPRVYHGELPLASIAALAPLVGQAAQSGDCLAADIIARAGEELCLAASAVVGRLNLGEEEFPCLLSGGIFAVPALELEMARRLALVAPRARVSRLADPPAVGAIRLALEELSGGAKLPLPL
jgi:N-acetylglucosamine kinase-like BadF-type ATPase